MPELFTVVARGLAFGKTENLPMFVGGIFPNAGKKKTTNLAKRFEASIPPWKALLGSV